MTSCLVRSEKGNATKPFYHVACVNGRWTCECPAYKFCKAAPKTCKHVRAVVEAGVEPVVVAAEPKEERDPFAPIKR